MSDKSDKNSSNNKDISTLLSKIYKLQERQEKLQKDQEVIRQQELEILKEHLAQMNVLLGQLVRVSESGSTVSAGKKIIPFQTGSQIVGQLNQQPTNPDLYPTSVDVYSINDSRVIPHMTLVNDGPGEIFFISAYAKNQFNIQEGHLNVNDQRELFNVYEIRLRSTLPLTTFRLIEGIFRTGSTAPQTTINTQIRPTPQANQVLVDFTITFDNFGSVTITSPTVQTFSLDQTPFGLASQPPLPPGATATLVANTTGLPMPFFVPEGFGIELFSVFANFSTDFTLRTYFEFFPGSGIFIENAAFPSSNRGIAFNQSANLSPFSTQPFFPLGVPAPGINVLATITNDDPFNNMIGDIDLLTIMSRLS